MNILILHRIPYHLIEYHKGIDHQQHNVVYLGIAADLEDIPADLTCQRWLRPGVDTLAAEAIEWLNRYLSQRPLSFDCVISLAEMELLSAAIIREHFNISGTSVRQIKQVRNKLLMKQAVARAGLKVPQHLSLSQFVTSSSDDWDGKVVLKPIDGVASNNVKVFAHSSVLRQALKQHTTGIKLIDDDDDFTEFEVETFVSGQILHFDGMVFDGELRLLLCSQYLGNCLQFAQGQPIGSVQVDSTAEYQQWVLDILAAVDITTGSFHLETIVSDHGLVFLEIANRIGGAGIVDGTQLATGVNLPHAELRSHLGEPLQSSQINISERKYGFFIFPGHHLNAQHCHISHAEQFQQHPNMVRWHQLEPDQPLTQHTSSLVDEVPLAGFVGADTSEELVSLLSDMFAVIEVTGIG